MGLSVLINGVSFRATDRYTIREQAGQPSVSSIDIKLDGNPLPVTHTKVQILNDGLPFFTGLINSVDTPVYSTKFETDIVPLEVISMETVFTRRLVSDVWTEEFTHDIVTDIFNDYLAEEGFTLGTIEVFDYKYDKYTVPSLRLSDVLIELGDAVGAIASIDSDLTFHFRSKNTFPSVSAPTRITKLKKIESGNDLKTVQRVSGASAETSIQTDVTTWQANQRNILLGYQIAEEPNITINSSPVEVGLIGTDEDNPDKTFLWGYGNNAVVVNNNATVQPTTGDTVATIFKGFYNIEIITENEDLKSEIASISGTSGKIEAIVVDTSITNPQDGENLSNGLLAEKSQREETVTLECNDITASKLFNTWILSYPELNIEGSYVITERVITDYYDNVFKINLKLKNRGFYTRYGQAYNKGTKEIKNLSIRTDDFVLKNSQVIENVTFTDEVEANQLFMIFTPGTTDIFSPVFFDGITPAGV